MEPMTKIPPMRDKFHSVMVWLFYPDTTLRTSGFWHKRKGWMDWGGRKFPIPCVEVEGDQPVGWRVMKEGE